MSTVPIRGIQHVNGTTSGTPNTPSTVTFPGHATQAIAIVNYSGSADLWISFDEGANYWPIDPKGSFATYIQGLKTLYIKSTSASVSYYILNGYYER